MGDKEDWKSAKQMEPKLRTFVPIIVRGQEGDGVRFWGFGKQFTKKYLDIWLTLTMVILLTHNQVET